jgi:hypothetical protein
MVAKIKSIVLFLFFLGHFICAAPLDDYNVLLGHLQNYNTLGFFILNNNGEWRRGAIYADNAGLCLIPGGKGFFQFFDRSTETLKYCRNAILRVNYDGVLCNNEGFPLYPYIRVNTGRNYHINYENNKIRVEYTESGIIEEYNIFLYWPKTLPIENLYGVYFQFDTVDI